MGVPRRCKKKYSHNKHQYLLAKRKSLHPLALSIALAITGAAPQLAQADNFNVSNLNDLGLGSLRKAIDDMNMLPGPHTIQFLTTPGETINLVNGDLDILRSLTITGPVAGDPSGLTLDAGGLSRIFFANPMDGETSLVIENMTLSNGKVPAGGPGDGGAVFVKDFDTTLNHVVISDSSARSTGGGIYIENNNLTLNHSLVISNSVSNTLISSGATSGGGIGVSNGNLTLNQSTVTRNSLQSGSGDSGADGYKQYGILLVPPTPGTSGGNAQGGGIFVINGTTTLNQSTISLNSISGGTGGNGGNGYDGTSGLVGGDGQDGADGGPGGNAQGAGLYITGYPNSALISQSTISGNITLSGQGGVGGYGGQGGHGRLGSDGQNGASGSPGDTGDEQGGGLFSTGGTTFNQSTITENSHGGISVFLLGPTNNTNDTTLTNSILSGNIGNNFEDRSTTPNSYLNVNYSLFGDLLIEVTGTQNNVVINSGNNPNLGPLQHNGNLTQTHKPSISSPAVNTGSNLLVTNFGNFSFDQRETGFQRIKNITVDMGSVERQNIIAPHEDEVLTRRDMVRELLKAKNGTNYVPPAVTEDIYSDVHLRDINANWIKLFKDTAYTEGCATDKFCPNMVVTKEQMAIAFLKTAEIVPDPVSNIFTDVPGGSLAADYINELNDLGLTDGCDSNKFCPNQPVTRKWFDTLIAALISAS